LIRQVPLFSELPESEIIQLATTFRVIEIPPNTIVFREGEVGHRFYIIQAGQLEVIKALDTPEEWVASVRGPGEYIGEMSLINRDGLRTASVRARTRAELLEITRDDFDSLLARQPSLAYRMVRVLSQRLNQANNVAITDLREKNRRLEQAYNELKEAQAQIIIKEKLEHELQVARQVQASLLPRQVPQVPDWEFAAHWEPAREVAGDFYDFISSSRDHIGVLIADVADKGMPSALFMALSRSILRASLTQATSLVDSFAQANRLICADSSDSMFVTLFYARLEIAIGKVTYLNAGHNPTLHYQAETDQLEWLAATGMPMGIDSEAAFGQRSLTLAPGDFLLLYTDGVPDALNALGEEFGTDRLWQLVYDHRQASITEIVTRVKNALGEFVGETLPVDDITIAACKRNLNTAK
jgi:serine phosphatase RsbU (regulator of sigma subunit)